MPKPLNDVDDARNILVYIVTVSIEDRINEQYVFASLLAADEKYKVLKQKYEGRTVCLTCRRVE